MLRNNEAVKDSKPDQPRYRSGLEYNWTCCAFTTNPPKAHADYDPVNLVPAICGSRVFPVLRARNRMLSVGYPAIGMAQTLGDLQVPARRKFPRLTWATPTRSRPTRQFGPNEGVAQDVTPQFPSTHQNLVVRDEGERKNQSGGGITWPRSRRFLVAEPIGITLFRGSSW